MIELANPFRRTAGRCLPSTIPALQLVPPDSLPIPAFPMLEKPPASAILDREGELTNPALQFISLSFKRLGLSALPDKQKAPAFPRGVF